MTTASRRATAALLVAATLTACGGDDDATSADGLVVSDVWARATPAGTTTGAIYFTLESDTDEVLVGASVDPSVAPSSQVHMSMTDANGATIMHDMGPFFVPAAEPLAFEPGSNHVMLIDLARPLVAGETFDLTLVFEQAGEQVTTVEVRDEAP